jgi:hypothetical protein
MTTLKLLKSLFPFDEWGFQSKTGIHPQFRGAGQTLLMFISNNLITNRHPSPHSLVNGFCGEEGVKNLILYLRGNPPYTSS